MPLSPGIFNRLFKQQDRSPSEGLHRYIDDTMIKKIYPRTGDLQTIYLNAVVRDPSIEIGDGAVIGARAVVAKDVEPYSIVGGVPAREIRKRFDADKIERLLRLRWWDWPVEKIRENIPHILNGESEVISSSNICIQL